MIQRMFISALVLAAMCGIAFVPAPDSAASGSLSVSLWCEPEPNGAICGASPSGNGNTVSWASTGNLTLTSGQNAVIQVIDCWGAGGGGTVTATITAPNGDTGSASRSIGCRQNQPW